MVDQYWTRRELGNRHIDLDDLAVVAAKGLPVAARRIVMPDLEALRGLALTLGRLGWEVIHPPGPSRRAALAALVESARATPGGEELVVVSSDGELLSLLRAAGLQCRTSTT